MNIRNTDTQTKNWVTLTIEVGADEFEQAQTKAFQKNVGRINVPGFRKGKAPRKIIERMYGENVFFEDAVGIAYPAAYAEALEQSGVEPVDQADINILEITSDGFSFEAKIPIKPELTMGQYKGLSAAMPEVVVAEADIDAELERLRERNARQVTVEREALDGDDVLFDFEGFVDGVAFEGGKADNHMLKLGSGQFIPGFEEQLVGAKAGDHVTVRVTFPQEYHAENLAGKEATFECDVHEVKETVKPELCDDFAGDVSEFDTLEELKTSIRGRFEASRKNDADRAFEESLIDQLIAGAEVELHDCMIDKQLDNIMQDFSYRLQQQRIDLKTYLSITNQTVEDLLAQHRPLAERYVRTNLIFEKVAELEALEVSQEELDAEYARLAERYKMELDQIKLSLDADMIRRDLLSLKASEFIKENAVRETAKKENEV